MATPTAPRQRPTVTWILLAAGHRAFVYAVEDRRWMSATKVYAWEHPETRMHAPDLVTDDLGRRRDRNRPSGPSSPGAHSTSQRSRMDPKTTLKDHEKQTFVREMIGQLDAGRNGNEFDELLVFAAPDILGLLRADAPKGLANLIVDTIDKDLTFVSEHDMPERLHKEMHGGHVAGETYATGTVDARLRNTKPRK